MMEEVGSEMGTNFLREEEYLEICRQRKGEQDGTCFKRAEVYILTRKTSMLGVIGG
jgi:hypothetical protein